MSELPLVSIIAVCYNQAKYAVETLDSIKNQTYPNIELIIMDDCSTDNSVEVIQQWIKETDYHCELVAHQENQGLCKTLNEALQLINGIYYQILACDDIILEQKIESQVDLFQELSDDYAVIFSDAIFMDENSTNLDARFIQRCRPRMLKVTGGDIYKDLLDSNFIPAPTVLLKTEIVKNLGGYDNRLFYEDYDLWLQIAKKYHFYFMPKIVTRYRIHENNLHTTKAFKEKELMNLCLIYAKHNDMPKGKKRFKHVVLQLYRTGVYKKFKNQIFSVSTDSKVFSFMKYNVNFKIYKLLLWFTTKLKILKFIE